MSIRKNEKAEDLHTSAPGLAIRNFRTSDYIPEAKINPDDIVDVDCIGEIHDSEKEYREDLKPNVNSQENERFYDAGYLD